MNLIQPFEPLKHDPTQSAGSLPIGRHPFVIESHEIKANSKNDGAFLQLNLRVIDGPQQGSAGPYRLNLYNNNETTVRIANSQLSAICHVVGVFTLGADGTDVSVLHNIPFIGEVGPQKDNAQYTEMKKVLDINGNEPTRPSNNQQPAQPAQPAAAAPAQWNLQPAAAAPAAPAQWNLQPAAAAPAAPAQWNQNSAAAAPAQKAPWGPK